MCLQEGDYESCVSRAYYSVYHALTALLLMEGVQVSHDELRRRAINWNRSNTRLTDAGTLERGSGGLGRSLETLRRWRGEADYQFGLTYGERARNSIEFADRVLRVVKEVLS